MRTFGVEEELLLVDPDTGVPVAVADLVALPDSGADPPGDPAATEAAHPASVSAAVGVRTRPVRDGAASKGGPPPATGKGGPPPATGRRPPAPDAPREPGRPERGQRGR